jgi:hypothetical protein
MSDRFVGIWLTPRARDWLGRQAGVAGDRDALAKAFDKAHEIGRRARQGVILWL